MNFNGLHLLESIAEYQQRDRRFGGLNQPATDETFDGLQPVEEIASELLRR